jgi:hypothetical protein
MTALILRSHSRLTRRGPSSGLRRGHAPSFLKGRDVRTRMRKHAHDRLTLRDRLRSDLSAEHVWRQELRQYGRECLCCSLVPTHLQAVTASVMHGVIPQRVRMWKGATNVRTAATSHFLLYEDESQQGAPSRSSDLFTDRLSCAATRNVNSAVLGRR